MMKFDNAKYRTVLNLIKKTGEFKGKAVPSKARLHEMIGEDTTEIFSEEEAKRNEKGIVEIKSEQAFQKLMVRFMEKLSELDAKIETFAESELKPYLER